MPIICFFGPGGSTFIFTYLAITPITGAITQTDLQNLGLILSELKTIWSGRC